MGVGMGLMEQTVYDAQWASRTIAADYWCRRARIRPNRRGLLVFRTRCSIRAEELARLGWLASAGDYGWVYLRRA
jgi:hypothetical protein